MLDMSSADKQPTKKKAKRSVRSVNHGDTALSVSLTQDESCADVIWRDSPPDSPVLEEKDVDALLHVINPEQAKKRIRVDRVDVVGTPATATQSTQHISQFTDLLSHLSRSTPTSAVKSPRTDRDTSSSVASAPRPSLSSMSSFSKTTTSTCKSVSNTPATNISTSTIHSTVSSKQENNSPDVLDVLTADDLHLLSQMEKSAEQYFTQIATENEEDASDSFAIDYDQLETVMQAAEEQFHCTKKLSFEERNGNADMESVTADEWQALEALEMAAIARSQTNVTLSADNWMHDITAIYCIRLRALSSEFQQASNGNWFKVISAKRDYLMNGDINQSSMVDDEYIRVELWDDWYHTTIYIDDVFHVVYFNVDSCSSSFRVDGSSCLLILHPDILLTPTKIAEACDCSRRMVLAERYRGLNGDVSPLAVMGNVKHDFVEMYVDRYLNLKSQGSAFDSLSQQEIENIRRRALANNCTDLYTCNFTDEDVDNALKAITPLVAAWAKDGIATIEAPLLHRIRGPCRHEVQGKEDTVWCPMLGIKGNIDMIIATSGDSSRFVTPIELKTGKWRPNTAVAHRAQAILYVLMLLFRERSAQSDVSIAGALLLYIYADGKIIETKSDYIFPKWCDIKALVQSRNNLAMYLHALSDAKLQLQGVRLPPLIRSPSCCETCFQAAECMHYHLAIEGGDEKTSGVPELFNYITSGLKSDDISYLQHWERLLNLENASLSLKNRQSEIWTKPAMWKMRSTSGCMANVKLAEWTAQGNDCILTFQQTSGTISKLSHQKNSSVFEIGDTVAVSAETAIEDIEDLASACKMWDVTHTEPHIVSGQVIDLKNDTVRMRVTDKPKRLLRSSMYRLFSSGHNVRRYSSRNKSSPKDEPVPRSVRLRELIVLRKSPKFSSYTCEKTFLFKPPNVTDEVYARVLKVLHKKRLSQCVEESLIICGVRIFAACNPLSLLEEYEKLNDDQRNAVNKVLTADDYVLLQGYPGTGKTQTVAFVIRVLVARNQRVLVTSYTHSAVNHILEKLVYSGMQPSAIARIGSNSNLNVNLSAYALQPSDTTTIAQLASRMKDVRVVMCTVLTAARNAIVQSLAFDWTVMDESGQISHPASLGPLLLANRMLMVGDTHQLPPLVISREAKEQGLEESLFKYLADYHPTAVAELSTQYRMNSDILTLCNALVYENRLRCGSDDIASAKLSVPNVDVLNALKSKAQCGWIHKSIHPDSSVLFINTDPLSINASSMNNQDYDFQTLKEDMISYVAAPHDANWVNDGREVLLKQDTSKITGVVNPSEVILIYTLVSALQQCGVDVAAHVGIMSPYRAQVALLDHLLCYLDPRLSNVACTIDTYQGRDKDMIIFSAVRSNGNGDTGELLKDWRRINVAITRAKRKLIVIGSRVSAENNSILSQLVNHMAKKKWIFDLPSNINILR